MASAPTSVAESTAGDLALHATGFELSLRATRKAPNTVKSYLASIVLLDEFLADKGMPRTVERIRRDHIESFQFRLPGQAPPCVRGGPPSQSQGVLPLACGGGSDQDLADAEHQATDDSDGAAADPARQLG